MHIIYLLLINHNVCKRIKTNIIHSLCRIVKKIWLFIRGQNCEWSCLSKPAYWDYKTQTNPMSQWEDWICILLYNHLQNSPLSQSKTSHQSIFWTDGAASIIFFIYLFYLDSSFLALHSVKVDFNGPHCMESPGKMDTFFSIGKNPAYG